MNKQTITSICSIAALSAALISSAYAGLVVTSTSLDVNFNDSTDSTNAAFQLGGTWNNYLLHDPTGGIAGDGALNFNSSYRSLNWKQSLTGGVGTVITQSMVFTKNNLDSSYAQKVPFMMGFMTGGSHVANPTAGNGASATADAFQLQIFHDTLDPNTGAGGYISTTLRTFIDGSNGDQKYSNFAYTGTSMLQFDLTLTRTDTNTFDWGYVVTDLGADGAGSSVVGTNTQSFTFTEFGTALDGGGIYAGLRSGDLTGGSLSGLDQWSVSVAVPEPSAYALLAGALALGSVMIRRRRS